MTIPCIITEGTVLEDFTDSAEWTKDTNVSASDKGWVSQTIGKLSIKMYLAPTAVGGSTYYMTKTISQSYAAYKSGIELVCYAGVIQMAISGGGKLTVALSSTSDFSKSFSYTTPSNVLDGWQKIHISESDWTNTGGESWSNTMIRLRIGITPQWTGLVPNYYLDTLTGGVTTSPAVVLRFSNAYMPPDEVLDYLAARDWLGVASLDLVSMDDLGRMTAQQYQQLFSLGWDFQGETMQTEILDPSYSHVTYPYYSNIMQAAIMDAYETIGAGYRWTPFRHWGTSNGWRVNLAEMNAVLANHSALTCTRSVYTNEISSIPMPFVNPLCMPNYVLEASISLATVKAEVDKAVARGGALIIMCQQLVDTSPSGWDWLLSDYLDLLDYIDAAAIDVMNLTQLYEFQSEEPRSKTMGEGEFVLGLLDLNDQVNYFVEDYGVNLGQRQTTWEEIPNYNGGSNVQVNVQSKGLILVTVPLRIKGTSPTDLDDKLDDLWLEVDKATNTLMVAGQEYSIVRSTRPDTIERDPEFQLAYNAHCTLVLAREA